MISISDAFRLAAKSQLRRCTKLRDHLFVRYIIGTNNDLVFFCVERSRFSFHFFNCYVSVSIKSLRLSQFSVFPLYVCLLICFVFFYNFFFGLLAYLSVGLSSLIPRLSFWPFCRGFPLSFYTKSSRFFFSQQIQTICFSAKYSILKVPFTRALLERRVTCYCVTHKQYMFQTCFPV